MIKDMREVLFNSLCNLCQFNIEGGEDAIKKVKSAAGHIMVKSLSTWQNTAKRVKDRDFETYIKKR